MFTDYYFWFAQPSSFLSPVDTALALVFGGLFVLGLVLWISKFIVGNPVDKKLLNKFRNLLVWIGIVGLIWFGFRFEGTQLLSKRIWPGLILLGGLIWLVFVLKYLILHFNKERKEYSYESLKQKYLPKSK